MASFPPPNDPEPFDTPSSPVLTRSCISNIRMAKEKPIRDGKPCPKNRDEPFEKIEVTDQILQLAGVKPY